MQNAYNEPTEPGKDVHKSRELDMLTPTQELALGQLKKRPATDNKKEVI